MRNIKWAISISILVLCITCVEAQNYIINTIAGDEYPKQNENKNMAIFTKLGNIAAVTLDWSGDLYFSEELGNDIRKIDTVGVITSIVDKKGIYGFKGDGQTAINAKINSPDGMVVDQRGNIYFSDSHNSRIRKVDLKGIITTIAGNGVVGDAGDGGLAINAELNCPQGIAIDKKGNIYIADCIAACVKKIDTSGIISTIAGNRKWGYNGDEIPAISAELNMPCSVAVDDQGNIYIADSYNNRIREIDSKGIIRTIAGNGLQGYNGEGVANSVELNRPRGVAVDIHGNVYIADSQNGLIRKVDIKGDITTIAGCVVGGCSGSDGGAATTVPLCTPNGLFVDKNSNVYVADFCNHLIRKLTPTR